MPGTLHIEEFIGLLTKSDMLFMGQDKLVECKVSVRCPVDIGLTV